MKCFTFKVLINILYRYKIRKKPKGTRNLGEYIFSHENPKNFWGSKAGPRPLCLYKLTLLGQLRSAMSAKLGRSELGPSRRPNPGSATEVSTAFLSFLFQKKKTPCNIPDFMRPKTYQQRGPRCTIALGIRKRTVL